MAEKKFPFDFMECVQSNGKASFLQVSDYNYLSQRLAYHSASASVVEYVGYSNPGNGISASAWAVKQLLYTDSAAGALLHTIGWANGENSFNKKWADRATYTYS